MNEAEKRGKDNAPIVQCLPQRHEINLLTGGAQLDQNGRKSTKTYTFDQIFDPRATQQDVYNEAVLPLVEEVMEGIYCSSYFLLLSRMLTKSFLVSQVSTALCLRTVKPALARRTPWRVL
jgi:hypothetical protein